jgi:DNA-binding IclR family transcriptional regulator
MNSILTFVDKNPGTNQAAVARHLGVTSAGVARYMKELVTAGGLKRQPDGGYRVAVDKSKLDGRPAKKAKARKPASKSVEAERNSSGNGNGDTSGTAENEPAAASA